MEQLKGSVDAARLVLERGMEGLTFVPGIQSAVEHRVPRWLNIGCLPIVIATGLTLFNLIKNSGYEHIFPSLAAAIVLLLNYLRVIAKKK